MAQPADDQNVRRDGLVADCEHFVGCRIVHDELAKVSLCRKHARRSSSNEHIGSAQQLAKRAPRSHLPRNRFTIDGCVMVASFHKIPWRETANGIPESMAAAVAKPKPCAWAMSGLSCSMTGAMEARCSRQFETWVARSECRRKCRHAVAFFDVIALDVGWQHTT